MNERIQQLAEQATSIVEMVGPQGYTSSYANFDREKFAELILQECLVLFENSKVNQEDDVDYGLEEAKNIIKEHFGVEE